MIGVVAHITVACLFTGTMPGMSAGSALDITIDGGWVARQKVPVTGVEAATCVNAGGTAQQTVTLPTCGPGAYQYVLGIWSEAQATTAPAASAVTTTTTNLNGLQLLMGLTATAGASVQTNRVATAPIKASLANTASTIVSNAAITNVTFNLTACYYCAP
jgi:hypothetical protein